MNMIAKPGLLICVCALLLAGGCARPTPVQKSDPIPVTASVYVMADIVRQIGGPRVKTGWFIESGQPLDPIAPTPRRRQQWLNASLVVTRGLPDLWTCQGAGDAYQDRRILRVDMLPSAQGGNATAYLWLDPNVGVEMAREVTDRLSALDPHNQSMFLQNLSEFVTQVREATAHADNILAKKKRTAFVSMDRGFEPLAARFGLVPLKLDSTIDSSHPDASSARRIRRTALAAGAGAIFASAELPDSLLQDWQARIGLPVLSLDAEGTSARRGRNSYLAVLRYNLGQLEHAAELSKPMPATGPTTMKSPRQSSVSPDTGTNRP